MKSIWTFASAAAILFLTPSGFAQQRTVVEFTGSGVSQSPIPARD
jgi:hypothetical protein